MNHSADTASFSEHRKHLRRHLEQVRDSSRPLFIATNGETDAVVLSPEVYDALVAKAQLVESLAVIHRSVEDIAQGRTRPVKEALTEIAGDLGLSLGRRRSGRSRLLRPLWPPGASGRL